ncbi:hypothetical protein FMEXI_4653 [Fusarium mexicanum]|uniref:Uncharacterized protein n=1 Tax=Fusarium mexicanum TaxID=751941 RepID=A0A8H5N1Z4_9HYPO|nr:hypothetical protein FMEXI_4653 [Fusarium mexicanum]
MLSCAIKISKRFDGSFRAKAINKEFGLPRQEYVILLATNNDRSSNAPMWETTDPSAKPVDWVDRSDGLDEKVRRFANGSRASITCHVSVNYGCTIVAPFALIIEAITAVQGSSLGDTAAETDRDNSIVLQDGLGLVQIGDVGKAFDVVAFSGNIQAHKLYAASCRKNKENVRIVHEVPLPSGRALVREDFTHTAMDVMKDSGVCIDDYIPYKNEEQSVTIG